MKLKCGHFFHRKCLNKWKKHNFCPVCREKIIDGKPIEKVHVDTTEEDQKVAERVQNNEYATFQSDLIGFESVLIQFLYSPVQCYGCQRSHIRIESIPCEQCGLCNYCSIECQQQNMFDHNCACVDHSEMNRCDVCERYTCVCSSISNEEEIKVAE